MFLGALILGIVLQCTLVCCKSVARKSPVNLIVLVLFTACWTYIVGAICSAYPTEIVVLAAGMTAVLSVTLMTYAYFTKTDFTGCCGPFVCWGLLLIIVV